ncbi:hypothetical protein C8F04DRAFT_985556 [Mycena alexandri]|uniref:Ubiquitin-like domain-containing protein n=1 Tax=Mycena alexandri TaxID=1745969 RepID=A0AAD6TLG8_9AGAR|nr:hypothetical protein C8F04DRAFT_985556 [Mycena alexandri]
MPLIRVELPAFSRTINVQVPDTCTILELKREIHRVCVGAPRVEGQRIIWRGRSLLDTEKVEELWQTPNEPRIVHLAVHPSAWSATPPDVPQAPLVTPSPIPPPVSSPFLSSMFPPRTPLPSIFAPANPFAYVVARHQQAFNALEQLKVSPLDSDTLAARYAAVQAIERHGWSWPTVLDDEFPAATEGSGVKYERSVIEGQTYLRLVESAEQPTAIQLHALNVLAATFPILALPVSAPVQTRVTTSQHLPNVPNVNALLQQLGLQAVRNGANANLAPNINIAVAQQPELPLRPLLLPLFLLMLRTAVLLYFFAPARKPVFGILIVVWMMYEVWRPIREGLQRGWARAAEQGNNPNQPQQQQQRQRNVPAQPVANGPANAGGERQGPAPQRPGALAANDLDQHLAAALDGLANFNMHTEEEAIRRGTPVEEPGFWSKAIAFASLFVTTMHPAVWNRRRAVLRQREGQIRMDANARAAELDENVEDEQTQARIQRRAQLIAQHEQRPRWLRAYMERAVEGGWVDEAD